MRSLLTFPLCFSAALALSLCLWGCGGKENDPCQQGSDCDDGLLCCSTTGAELSGSNGEFGACRAVTVCPRSTSDAGTDAATDAASEDAASEDASAEDAGADAGTDSGSDAATDAGAADASADASDGAVDAGT